MFPKVKDEEKSGEWILVANRLCSALGNYDERGKYIDEIQFICCIIKSLQKSDIPLLKGKTKDQQFKILDENPIVTSVEKNIGLEAHPQTQRELKTALKECQSIVGWDGDYNSIKLDKYLDDLDGLFDELESSKGEKFTDKFNGDISLWDVSKVKNFDSLFANMKAFNCNLDSWDFTSAESMENMFYNTKEFNNGDKKIEWKIPNCMHFDGMFYAAKGVKEIDIRGFTQLRKNKATYDDMFVNSSIKH